MMQIERKKIIGRLLPNFEEHRSDIDPRTGERKNPKNGDNAHTMVIFLCSIPMDKRIGATKAVSAEYANLLKEDFVS
jgi:hypothetical protein